MNQEYKSLHEELNELVKDWFLIIPYARLDRHSRFILSYGTLIEDYFQKFKQTDGETELTSLIKKSRTFKTRLLNLVVKDFSKLSYHNFNTDFNDFSILLENMVPAIDSGLITGDTADNGELEKRALELCHVFLSIDIPAALFEILEFTYRKMKESSVKLWEIDERLDKRFAEIISNRDDSANLYRNMKKLHCHDEVEELSRSVLNYKSVLTREAEQIISNELKKFEGALPELINNSISHPDETYLLKEKYTGLNKKYSGLNSSWKNNLTSLFHDWKKHHSLN
ncbi:MAG: hypothetical protein NTW49_03225 [Bacteroidia bacterium]|nr:hypothetical protein [Bacteroidia bacterium]